MHVVVMESLEEYLSGTLNPESRRDIEAHLSICESCRQEVAGMQEISGLFSAMVPDEVIEPAPGFYARVMREVGSRRPVPTFAGLFGLDLAFARRLVFASLLLLAALGSYLVTRESEYPAGSSPEAVMAQQDSPQFENAPAHEAMLATLTTYEP
ncbi:MAG TPA: zf-HC2 domain-containing protein [Candidatus Acidoferrales bacterium]|nr:zf-HC2 domain-containing protein [Candidatus Acidoferrales bacterium]